MGKKHDDTAESQDMDVSVGELPAPSTDKEEYDSLFPHMNAIAKPVAPRKLAKKLYKLLRKSAKSKKRLLRGTAEIQRGFRKNVKGLVIMAGNVSPIDIYSHIPALCEEKEVEYVFTPSKEHLGLACGHKRCNVILMVLPDPAYEELYNECVDGVKRMA